MPIFTVSDICLKIGYIIPKTDFYKPRNINNFALEN